MQNIESLIETYEPSEQVKQQLGKLTLVMTVGPSGTGKTTLMRESGIPLVLGDTTRTPRAGESQGVDYNFIPNDESLVRDIKDGNFAQVAIGPAGDIYATRANSYPNEGVATFAVIANALHIFRHLGFADTKSVFVVPPSFEIWQQRMGVHSLTDTQKEKRLKEARASLEISLSDFDMKFLLNDDLQTALEEFKKYSYNNEEPASNKKARNIARSLLETIDSNNSTQQKYPV
jgi:guanylate kinase